MSGCSGNAIDERIRIFADYVRNDNANFKPGESWWILNHTSESRKEYPGAISLSHQPGNSTSTTQDKNGDYANTLIKRSESVAIFVFS